MPLEEVLSAIAEASPALVCAPHVETATGTMLPDDYIAAVAAATHAAGGLFVLDCIASGNVWADMEVTGVDVLISAPQKGWTGPACCGLVMMSERARTVLDDEEQQPEVNSFCCNFHQGSLCASWPSSTREPHTAVGAAALLVPNAVVMLRSLAQHLTTPARPITSMAAAAASSFYDIVETASDGSEVSFSKVRDAVPQRSASARLPSLLSLLSL